MPHDNPAQRTASTARVVLGAGILFVIEAAWGGSVIRAMLASLVMALGAGLLSFARRSEFEPRADRA
jgi:hypothetical protein